MSTPPFCAGAAQVKTTPPLGTRINGDFVTHYANFIHDDLYAKALVLQNGEVTVAMVVVDICIMPKDFLDQTKVEIEKVTGIPFAHILISSTHTHAAGSVADVHLGSTDPAYAKKLPGLIVSAVQQAIAKMRPATIGFGSVAAPEHLLCRRYEMAEGYTPFNPVTGEPDQIKTNPFGVEDFIVKGIAPTDPELGYLAVKDMDGQWIGLLANYSLHYVGDWENGTISADYFGVFAAQLTEKIQAPAGFVCMMSNGTSGDVNIWDFKDSERYPKAHFEKSKVIGTDLADKVFQDLPGISWQENPQLSVLYHETEIDVVKPSPQQLLSARQIVSAAHYEDIVIDQDGLRQIYAREQLLLDEFPDKGICPVQAIRIGHGVIGALAGEFFSETGLYLKENITQGPYFTITMANGNVGYVPPAAEIAKGGYETWRCRYSCLVPGAEKAIREKLLSLVQQLTVDM
ncbi:hypothetical protein [Dyadobacter bucti]|uniref:hypothetical protein n=1 Tax=Dyadobacter bucti TaxID=2572203 RepID=UPI001108505B|nr:hypothetical protein [Dyadobacter bucti]